MTIRGMQTRDFRKGLCAKLRLLKHDERGGPMVEFAFLAPIFASMILASVELANAMETARRASTAANVVADLLSREVAIPSDGSISTYFTRINDAANQILDLPEDRFAFHVAHIYHNDVGNYDTTHASSWQYASHLTGSTGMSAPACDSTSMAYSDFANGDAVHSVAPEFREVQDVVSGDTPQTVRNALLSQSGTVVVVRLTYCYEPLLFGVINDIVGESEIVATFAPRNTRCIPLDSSTDGDGSSVTDCTAVDGYTTSTSGTSGS